MRFVAATSTASSAAPCVCQVAATWAGAGLVALAPDGSTHTSAEPDGPWQHVGSLPGSGAALAADGETLYAAASDGRMFVSRDGGASWSPPDDTT